MSILQRLTQSTWILGHFLALVISSVTLADGSGRSPYDSVLYFEQHVNFRSSQVLATGENQTTNDFDRLGPTYDPKSASRFDIGYLLIPIDQARAWTADADFGSATVNVQGVSYFRFFIHPLMIAYYAPEIEKYGPLRWGYQATPTASPRSLIITNKSNPQEFFYQKLSLDVDIGGVARINSNDKLIRSVTATRVLNTMKASLAASRIFYFPESQAIKAPFHNDGNILREIPFSLQHANGAPTMVPGFALLSPDPNGKILLLEMIKKSKLSTADFLRAFIVEPLVRSHTHLALEHGLIHEGHVQNILFGLDPNGNLNGQIIYRDLDSIKTDFEMRHLRGLDLSFYQDVTDPIETYQSQKAKSYYDIAYGTYLRGDWTHRIASALKNQENPSLLSTFFGSKLSQLSQKEVQAIFDEVLLEETMALFGDELVEKARALKVSPVTMGLSLNTLIQLYKQENSSLSLEQIPMVQRKAPPAAAQTSSPFEVVKFEKLRAGQLIKASSHVLRWAREEVGNNPERFVFEVIKYGSPENPLYMLLDGHHRAVVIEEDHKLRNWKVRVLEDITHLDISEQLEQLSLHGFFWHPEDNQSEIKLVKLTELETNFWRDLAAYKSLRTKYAHLYPSDVHFSELHFAKGLYQELLKRGHKPHEMSESQVVKALESRASFSFGLSCLKLLGN